MNNQQRKAVTRLKNALNNCADVGLCGGVYEGSFCIWPLDLDPHVVEVAGDNDFMSAVEDQCAGDIIESKMYLDGGGP